MLKLAFLGRVNLQQRVDAVISLVGRARASQAIIQWAVHAFSKRTVLFEVSDLSFQRRVRGCRQRDDLTHRCHRGPLQQRWAVKCTPESRRHTARMCQQTCFHSMSREGVLLHHSMLCAFKLTTTPKARPRCKWCQSLKVL